MIALIKNKKKQKMDQKEKWPSAHIYIYLRIIFSTLFASQKRNFPYS